MRYVLLHCFSSAKNKTSLQIKKNNFWKDVFFNVWQLNVLAQEEYISIFEHISTGIYSKYIYFTSLIFLFILSMINLMGIFFSHILLKKARNLLKCLNQLRNFIIPFKFWKMSCLLFKQFQKILLKSIWHILYWLFIKIWENILRYFSLIALIVNFWKTQIKTAEHF